MTNLPNIVDSHAIGGKLIVNALNHLHPQCNEQQTDEEPESLRSGYQHPECLAGEVRASLLVH